MVTLSPRSAGERPDGCEIYEALGRAITMLKAAWCVITDLITL